MFTGRAAVDVSVWSILCIAYGSAIGDLSILNSAAGHFFFSAAYLFPDKSRGDTKSVRATSPFAVVVVFEDADAWQMDGASDETTNNIALRTAGMRMCILHSR